MITELRLERFQGFEIPQSIRLAPLTLIYGPNSGGKSSILRALRFMDQAANDSEGYSFNGPKISLGGFRPAVFSGDKDATFKIGFSQDCRDWRVALQRRLSSNLFHDRREKSESLWNRSISISYEFDAGGEGYPLAINLVHTFALKVNEDGPVDWAVLSSGELVTAELELRRVDRESDSTYEITHIGGTGVDRLAQLIFDARARQVARYSERENPGLDLDESDAKVGDGWRKLVLDDEFLLEEGTFPDISSPGQSFLGDQTVERSAANSFVARYFFFLRTVGLVPETSHIGPLRTISSNFEYLSPHQNLKPDGSNILSFLASFPKDQLDTLSEWLQKMTAGRYGLQIISADIGETDSGPDGFRLTGADITNLYLKDFHTKVHVSPANAGVGLSQVLPVLASLVVALNPRRDGRRGRRMALSMRRRDKVLLIEQPELHLHPRMQAELADIFGNFLAIDAAQEGVRPAQLVVETHSEALLMRLQKLMAAGRIGPDDVSIIYVDQFAGGGNLAQELRINADGTFKDSWPTSFSELRWAEMGD